MFLKTNRTWGGATVRSPSDSFTVKGAIQNGAETAGGTFESSGVLKLSWFFFMMG